jgi:serine/threonine protein kinase
MQTMTMAQTQTGMIVGTLSYMSPEQARGLPADRRSDVFSFGIVLYEMAAGKLPFEGASALDTMHMLAFEPAAPVSTHRTDMPWTLQRVIDRCLQKKAEDRYQDLREAVADLKRVKREIDSGVSSGAPVAERMKGWTRQWTSGLSTRGTIWAVILGVIVIGVVVILIINGSGISVPGVIMTSLVGLWIYRRFRNRRQREMRRFVKKASSMREVSLVSFSKGQFTVVAANPTARTYVKLNALLTTANQRLYTGEPMTLVVRENLPPEETTRILSSPGVQFVRDDAARRPLVQRAG